MLLDASSNPEGFHDVYTGVWTDWTHGAVFGARLTLGRSEANLMIAFLALFITVVGSRTWRVACFGFHQLLSSETVQDGLYHQRQAILRNSSNATSGLITLIELTWARRSGQSCAQVIPIIAFATLFIIAFATASGLSSHVALGNEVLIASPRCGLLASPSFSDNYTLYQTLAMPYYNKKMQNAANYAQQCYNTDTSGELECGTFIKKNLQSTVVTNASCPFHGGICRGNNTSLLMDTGYVDSHRDLGLNSPLEGRFQYRRVLHCSPLVTEGYKSTWNISGDRSYTRYYYGEAVDANFTYEYTNNAIWELIETDANSANADYDIGMKRAIYQNGSLVDTKSDFKPIANLERPDANVLLFFLSAGQVVFNTQTIDDWYRATHKVADVVPGVLSNDGSSISVYGQDESASPLACTSQTQLCSSQLPEDKRCTPLGGDWDTYDSAEVLFRGDALWDMFSWMYFDSLGVEQVVGDLGTQSLKSRDTLSGGIQGPLPDNQWQLDIQHWFATASAYQQASAISYATGPNANLQRWVLEPNTTTQRAICRNQKILSNAHVSFSFFGICFAFATGAVIILISFVLEPVLGCVQKRHHLKDYARLEWCTNETLQLQRLAHEEVGAGTWSRATDAIPMTEHGEPLAMLDLEDREHPRLRGPGKADEDMAGLPVAVATGGCEGAGTEEVEEPQAKGGQGAGKANEKAGLSHTAVTTTGLEEAGTEEIGEPQEQSSDGSVVGTGSSANDSVPQDENASLHLL